MKTGVLASLGMLCALQLAAQPAVPQFTIELAPSRSAVRLPCPACIHSRARSARRGSGSWSAGARTDCTRSRHRRNRRAAGECIPAAAGEQPAVGDRSEREEGLSTGEHSGAAARRFARRHECRVVSGRRHAVRRRRLWQSDQHGNHDDLRDDHRHPGQQDDHRHHERHRAARVHTGFDLVRLRQRRPEHLQQLPRPVAEKCAWSDMAAVHAERPDDLRGAAGRNAGAVQFHHPEGRRERREAVHVEHRSLVHQSRRGRD